MALPDISVNYLSVLVASLVSFFIGWLWHGVLFGKAWVREMKFSKREIEKAKKKGMAKPLILNFVGTLIVAYVLAMILILVGVRSVGDGALLGFWVWLGFFVASTLLNQVLWEGKSWVLFLINSGFWLVNLVVMGMILAGWR